MVALASKIFSRPDDLPTAEALTKGCIWAYEASPNKIAPELFTLLPCPTDPSSSCTWSDQIWHDALTASYGGGGTGLNTEAAIKIAKERRLYPGFAGIDDRRYILRPEAIESVFLLYRITGKQEYADAAWRMFEAVEKVSRTPIAAAAIADITVTRNAGEGGEDGKGVEGQQMDSMESFWLAETLKYFYLCFEEWGVVSLDEYVLNTEAHPLRRPS